jgi:hypothetical protein
VSATRFAAARSGSGNASTSNLSDGVEAIQRSLSAQAAQQAFHHGAARIYRSEDLPGVEVGGALKNVMAIAAGICDGLSLGLNARAALLTRGLAEIARYAAALGGDPRTLMGLAGMGDLVLTCTGDLSRNRAVGLRLATGQGLEDILTQLGHVAEGVACCRAVQARARTLGIEMPASAAFRLSTSRFDVEMAGRASSRANSASVADSAVSCGADSGTEGSTGAIANMDDRASARKLASHDMSESFHPDGPV